MITIEFDGRTPIGLCKTGQNIGNRGDADVVTLKFLIDKEQMGIDLTDFDVTVEWLKQMGGQDIESLTSSVDTDDSTKLAIEWLLPAELLATAGRGSLCLEFSSDDVIFRTDNIPIQVTDTINVGQTILPDLPESYTVLLSDVELLKTEVASNTTNIAQNTSDIALKANSEQEDEFQPAMLNGALSETGDPIRYYKDNFGRVWVRGSVYNSDGTLPCAKLVDGYLSDELHFIPVSREGNALEPARIEADGNIYITVPDDDVAYFIISNKGID